MIISFFMAAIAVCRAPPSRRWGQLHCLLYRVPKEGHLTANWIVLSCCRQPPESSTSWVLLCLSRTHACKYRKEVQTWHTAQLRRIIRDEYLLGIFIKCLGSWWFHHLNDGSSIKNYAGSIRSLNHLRWRQVFQVCQLLLLLTSRLCRLANKQF